MAKNNGKPVKHKKGYRGNPGVEVCNIHRLWKIVAPLVLRRRKQDIGEDIVKMHKHVIRVPMGKEQFKVYRYHLRGVYEDDNGRPALMAQLTALRKVAAAPDLKSLHQLPPGCEIESGPYRSSKPYTPKLASCLQILEQRMKLGEQTIVFSAFQEPLDTLSAKLTEAAVPHDVLDGRKSAKVRGERAGEFKQGLPKANPVMLAGLKAMGEGGSFHLCRNVIIICYDWAMDIILQALERIYRFNSPQYVNDYCIVCDGTIDRKLEAGIDEKRDSAELVIDGRLMGESVNEVNPRELIKIANEEFAKATVYDEDKLITEWPELRNKLGAAWRECKTGGMETEAMPEPVNRLPLSALLNRVKQMQLNML
jgi:SNF2 family DNA or RNA helicase